MDDILKIVKSLEESGLLKVLAKQLKELQNCNRKLILCPPQK